MQTIKDFLDPDLAFLSDIYGSVPSDDAGTPVVHPYHDVLALLAMDFKVQVFTTNFDRGVERAIDQTRVAGLPRMGIRSPKSSPWFLAYQKTHFQRALKRRKPAGLFKLHGSVDDPRTLAATYDTIAPASGRLGDPRQNLFAHALGTADLCVVGYSGFDDMDVVPTILQTKAPSCSIHWFHHNAIKRNRSIQFRDFARDVDRLDPRIERDKKPILPILNKLVSSGHRFARRITVHCGRTETTLVRFLRRHFPGKAIQEACERLLKSERKASRVRRMQATQSIEKWTATLPPYHEALFKCAAIDVFYQHSAGDQLYRRLARELDALTRISRSASATRIALRIVALPKLSKVAYALGDYDRVAKLAREAEYLYGRITARKVVGSTEMDPALVAASLSETDQWAIEALRLQDAASASAKNRPTALASNPVGVLKRLASNVKLWKGGRFVSNPARFGALRAGALTTNADIQFTRGNFRKAKQAFDSAKKEWSRCGNGYWKAYCTFSSADCDLQLGELAQASAGYKETCFGNVLSGWARWIDLYPDLHMLDLERIRRPAKWNRQQSETDLQLVSIMKQRDDRDAADIAATLFWSRDWGSSRKSPVEVRGRFSEIISRRGWRDIDRLALQLLFVEYLMRVGLLIEAEQLSRRMHSQAESLRARLFSLRASILLLEVHRRQKKRIFWRALFGKCKRAGFQLGAAYVLAIAIAAGERPPSRAIRDERGWALKNGIKWLAERLRRQSPSAQTKRNLQLGFPFCYM